eukprot:2330241-Rhodomonas_salina.2
MSRTDRCAKILRVRGEGSEATEAENEEEMKVKEMIDTHKARYKDKFNRLRELKAEIEQIQVSRFACCVLACRVFVASCRVLSSCFKSSSVSVFARSFFLPRCLVVVDRVWLLTGRWRAQSIMEKQRSVLQKDFESWSDPRLNRARDAMSCNGDCCSHRNVQPHGPPVQAAAPGTAPTRLTTLVLQLFSDGMLMLMTRRTMTTTARIMMTMPTHDTQPGCVVQGGASASIDSAAALSPSPSAQQAPQSQQPSVSASFNGAMSMPASIGGQSSGASSKLAAPGAGSGDPAPVLTGNRESRL